MSKAFDEKYCHSCGKPIKKDNKIHIFYDQSKDCKYIEKYYHKGSPTWISYFETSDTDDFFGDLNPGSFSTLFIGENDEWNSLSFKNTKYDSSSPSAYKHFELRYFYIGDYGNNQYPMLIDTDITQIKVKLSFDNEPEKITKEFNKETENENPMWNLKKNDSHSIISGELITVYLKTSDPGIENLLPKLLKHKTVTIIIEVPESKDPDKLTRSMTFDLDNFQRLYNKYNAYFK
ncbi:hypothetical protein QIA30_06690 (plasmid) [Borreliella turdi]|uniref:hypothetical protein n=1 Tax=Borreliella turdi TaxID=57863 RepID=UPI003AEF539F